MEQESQLSQLDNSPADAVMQEIFEAPVLLPEEAVALQAFNEIQQAEAEKAAEKEAKPKKLSKREEIYKIIPAGIQLYFDNLTQLPQVGDKVTVKSPKLHDKDGVAIPGKYGVGPVVMTSKVATVFPAKVKHCINKVVCENDTELVLRRTGQWELTSDAEIKKPHKRHIVFFREKYDDISPELLEKIKDLSNKKRKTEREVKAIENKRAKATEKKESSKKKATKPKTKKVQAKVAAGKKSKAKVEESSSESESESEESQSETDEEVPVELIVNKLAERVESIIDEKLSKVLGKRKREAEPEKPAKKAKRPAKKAKKSSK